MISNNANDFLQSITQNITEHTTTYECIDGILKVNNDILTQIKFNVNVVKHGLIDTNDLTYDIYGTIISYISTSKFKLYLADDFCSRDPVLFCVAGTIKNTDNEMYISNCFLTEGEFGITKTNENVKCNLKFTTLNNAADMYIIPYI